MSTDQRLHRRGRPSRRDDTSGVARASGPDLNMELTLVFTMRKGRIFYLEFFWDHAEALEAVGLSE